MQRLLARIVEVEKLGEAQGPQGFKRGSVRLRVKVLGPGAKPFRLPKGLKGRTGWVCRQYLEPWIPRKGDLVILDPEESARLIAPLWVEPPIIGPNLKAKLRFSDPGGGAASNWEASFLTKRWSGELVGGAKSLSLPSPESPGAHRFKVSCGGYEAQAVVVVPAPDQVLIYRLDLNRDGFEELVIENEFARMVVLPHLGGRVGSLYELASPRDWFTSPLSYIKDEGVEFGGADDRVGKEPPGGLWDVQFNFEPEGSGVVMRARHGGFEVVKELKLLPEMPIVVERICFHLNRAQELTSWHRLPIAGGWPVRLYIPTQERLERLRYYTPRGWPFRHRYYGLKLEGGLIGDERSKQGMLCLASSLEVLTVKYEPWGVEIDLRRSPVKAKRGEEKEYRVVYALGEGFSASENSLILMGNGAASRAFVLVRTQFSGQPTGMANNQPLDFRYQELDGLGGLWVALMESNHEELSAELRVGPEEFRL